MADDLGKTPTEAGLCAEWIDWAEVELVFEVEAFKDRRAAFADFLNARGEEFPGGAAGTPASAESRDQRGSAAPSG